MKKEYTSLITGEVVESKREILKAVIEELKVYHIINWRWEEFKEETVGWYNAESDTSIMR